MCLPERKSKDMEILEYRIGTDIKAFSTRRGAPSGSYGSFNITHYCGDTAEHVAACRAELCNHLGIADEWLILPRQTHGCRVLCIDKGLLAHDKEVVNDALQGVDAVITALPRTCIGVSTADCVPILLCDCTKGVVAAVHAGWRGTVACIVKGCIAEMQRTYGCKAPDIKAVIGPSIGCDAFEVGDEVYEEFRRNGFPMERIAKRMEKWHIDLWEANRLQLTECGVVPCNIEIVGICTHSRSEEFFSARRLGINSGRIFNGIMIE